MKVLVVGSGAREHALVWKFRSEPSVREVLCAPGNAGIARDAACFPIAATDVAGLLELARDEGVDLTVVGPEAPLELGLSDIFASEGLALFGPTRAAARLETSKAFAKHLMALAGVPTARYRVASSPDEAHAAIDELGGAVALKADGLAGGKGVIVAGDVASARAAVDALMVQRKVGAARGVVLRAGGWRSGLSADERAGSQARLRQR
jgi:phosphoribosylamine--glycine ligase